MGEVTLLIDDEVFTLKKDVLCEYSDYFRAMFSGNYVENYKQQVKINIVDANSMKLIVSYMENGLIDLTEFSLAMLSDLAVSANFLQITELLNQIECTLDLQLALSNWMSIMTIAEASSFPKLQKFAAAYGLLSFQAMKPEYIPSIEKLFWYLSHPHLNVENELSVFKFGMEWISNCNHSADAVLIVLGCLDLASLTVPELEDMKNLMKNYKNSLAASVVNCLHDVFVTYREISLLDILKNKAALCELFTERMCNELLSLVRGSTKRQLVLVPCVSISSTTDSKEKGPQYLYTFKEGAGFEEWLEVAERNLWGWSISSWGPTKLVMVGGQYRGTNIFMRDVMVWDTLRKEWTKHGVELPQRRHAGVTVIGNQLYMVGGVELFGKVLSSMVVYDLEERSFRKLKDFPYAIEDPPVCSHYGELYVAGDRHIYRYNGVDWWVEVVETNFQANYLVSLGQHIYVTRKFLHKRNCLFRFEPYEDELLEEYMNFSNQVVAMCRVGKNIIAFTEGFGSNKVIAVEEYINVEHKTRVIWFEEHSSMIYREIPHSSRCCALVMTMPPLYPAVSQYANQYLSRFKETGSPC